LLLGRVQVEGYYPEHLLLVGEGVQVGEEFLGQVDVGGLGDVVIVS
jgi:hypothetical protein